MKKNDKAKAAALRWQVQHTAYPYTGKSASLRVDTIGLSDGKETEYAYLERAPAVVVVPVTRDGQIIIVDQYRYPTDDWCTEVPAGGTHDTGDESLEEVARKELREEVGATCGRLTYVGWFYSGPALTDEKCHVFLAENVDAGQPPDTEPGEVIKIRLAEVEQVLDMARTGKMTNSVAALAVLLCEPLLRERGYL